MEITEVKVFRVREEKLKAFVSIVIDDCFMVNDIKVIQGRESRFISMPSRRKRNGEFKDVAHPLDNDTRSQLEARILEEYDRVVEEGGDEPVESDMDARPPRRRRRRRRRSGRRRQGDPAVGKDTSAGEQASRDEPSAAAPTEESPREPAVPAPAKPDSEATSLEEVAEKHLSDSFWST
jgi:stage V sporulation protein G